MEDYENRLFTTLSDIFNTVHYFGTLLHEDLPYRSDLIHWAYDLRDYVFEMGHCEGSSS